MIRLLPLLLLLSACATPAGNCRAAWATYYAMLAGGSPVSALEMARRDVEGICAMVPAE